MAQTNEESRLPARVDRGPALALDRAGRGLAVLEEWEPTSAGLQGYVNLLQRRRWAMLISLAGVLALSLLVTALTPRTYEAGATLLISETGDGRAQANANDASALTAMGSPNLDTHVQLLEGDSTAEETARWLRQHGGPDLSPEVVKQRMRAKPVRGTQLIRIVAVAGTAEEAQKIATAAAEGYVTANRRRARGSSETTGRYLGEQLALAKQNLTRAEHAVQVFKEATGTVATDASATDLLARLAALRGEADKTGADLAQGRQREVKIVSQLREQNAVIQAGQVRNDAVIQQLRTKLADLQGQRLAAQAKYTSSYSGPVRQIDEQIKSVKEQLNAEIRHIVRGTGGDLTIQQTLTGRMIEAQAEVASVGARHAQVLSELGQAKGQLSKIPGRQLTLAGLQRQMDVAEGIYSDLLKRSQEVEVGRVMALGNAEVAEPAARPRFPVRPNIPLNLALGLLLGLAVGVGLALLQDELDDTVRDQTEAARLTQAPVLGTIPAFDQPEAAGANGAAHGTALEAYRALRYCLDFVAAGERGRVVLVTSAGPAEGKTTTVLNLAMAVALTGRRVVLMDTDLRRSGLRRMLDVYETKGITDLLMGEADLREVLQRNQETGLMLISSGKQAANPTELLDSKAMRNLIEELRGEADLIILDSPPVLSVADTLVLSCLADVVLMVAVAGESHRYDLQLARQLLAHVGESITGVVLNKVGHKAGYGYHNRYYYY